MAPSSVPGAPWCPSGTPRSPKSSQKHTQRDPKEIQGRPLGAPGASQERPRVPKERPEGAQERSWEVSGEAKSRESGSPRRKKSILAKVLRDSALPLRGALWTSPNRSKIDPECAKWVLEPLGRPLRSCLVAQERLRHSWGPIRIDSQPLKCLRMRFPCFFMLLGLPRK